MDLYHMCLMVDIQEEIPEENGRIISAVRKRIATREILKWEFKRTWNNGEKT